jgi:hypothetical protein
VLVELSGSAGQASIEFSVSRVSAASGVSYIRVVEHARLANESCVCS